MVKSIARRRVNAVTMVDEGQKARWRGREGETPSNGVHHQAEMLPDGTYVAGTCLDTDLLRMNWEVMLSNVATVPALL